MPMQSPLRWRGRLDNLRPGSAFGSSLRPERFVTRLSTGASRSEGPSMMDRSYENAIKVLDSRQRRSRPAATSTKPVASQLSLPSSSGTPGLRGTPSIEGMDEWLRLLGYHQQDLSRLNIIHVAGTKGKGSTCAFIESILRSHGQRTGFPNKTGLYTSPHLIKPEERIRIDSMPLKSDLLAKYLFEVYDKLPQLSQDYDPSKTLIDRGPRYLQLFALLAFHVFIQEKVDLAIIETHSGGEYDATNVVQHPVVTAITTLGMDHIDMLGPTIENIAWHKAGIFKHGAVACSAAQEPGLDEVLKQRAAEKGVELTAVDETARHQAELRKVQPAVQRTNACLAITASEAWLDRTASAELTSSDISQGIARWSWPGRFQKILDRDGRTAWFLDAAHNAMSVKLAAQWFGDSGGASHAPVTRVLVFTHINELRDAEALLSALATALHDAGATMDHVVFTTYHASLAAAEKAEASVPPSFHTVWRDVFPASHVHDEVSIDAALEHARRFALDKPAHILISGSQHLVGPALEILQPGGTAEQAIE